MINSPLQNKSILITGGQGLIGTYLSKKLLLKGFKVSILSRSKKEHPEISFYTWESIDKEEIAEFDTIIHLAGSAIAKRWTAERKQLIFDSRVKTCEFLYKLVDESRRKPSSFISASGVGFYGAQTSNHIFEESDPAGNDFLGTVCKDWEESTNRFRDFGMRTVSIRTGVVLSSESDIIRKMCAPIKFGLGAAFGNGQQYFPWIHIADLCDIYIKAIEDQLMSGPYNAVAPENTTNKEFLQLFSKILNKPYWLPNIPSFILRYVLGEMSVLLTEGGRISADKMEAAGYKFKFPKLEQALFDLFLKK